MKLVLVIIAGLLLSSQAASISSEDSNTDEESKSIEEKAEASTVAPDSAEIKSSELDEFTAQDKNSTSKKEPKPKKSPLDAIPPPFRDIIRLLTKEALKNFDLGAICDTISVIDWQSYKAMLEQEDYEGFKAKITKDDILTSIYETMQEIFNKYTRIFLPSSNGGLQNSFLEFLSLFNPPKKSKKPCGIEKTIKDLIIKSIYDKGIPKDDLQNMQKSVKLMLETLQKGNVLTAGAAQINTNDNKLKI